MSKKIYKNIVNGILSMLLTLSLFITFVWMAVGLNLGNKSISKYIITSGYGDSISQKILSKLYNYADINSLPHEIFDNFVDSTLISAETYEYIVSISNKQDYEINVSDRSRKLEEDIKDYALKNMNLSEQQVILLDRNISDLVNECVNVYEGTIKSDVLENISKYISIIDKYFKIGVASLIIVDVFLAFVLVSSQKWKHRGYRYSLYSLIATELMLCLLLCYISFNNMIKRINIMSHELYDLAYEILKGCINSIYLSCLIVLVLIGIDSYIYIKSKKSVK